MNNGAVSVAKSFALAVVLFVWINIGLSAMFPDAWAPFASADEPLSVLVSWKPGQTEAALRKIERTGLTVIEMDDHRAVCRGKQSSATVAAELRHEPEFQYAYADVRCEAFVVSWGAGNAKSAMADLQQAGAIVIHRGQSLPFAVCKGPLTAEIQEQLAETSCIETVEPEASE